MTKKALDFLNQRYQQKRAKNKSFSIRAFAKHLKISPTALSEGLRGNRSFPENVLRRIAEKLQLSPLETAAILLNQDLDYFSLESTESDSLDQFNISFVKLNLNPERLRELLIRLHRLRLEAELLSQNEENQKPSHVLKIMLSSSLEEGDGS